MASVTNIIFDVEGAEEVAIETFYFTAILGICSVPNMCSSALLGGLRHV